RMSSNGSSNKKQKKAKPRKEGTGKHEREREKEKEKTTGNVKSPVVTDSVGRQVERLQRSIRTKNIAQLLDTFVTNSVIAKIQRFYCCCCCRRCCCLLLWSLRSFNSRKS